MLVQLLSRLPEQPAWWLLIVALSPLWVGVAALLFEKKKKQIERHIEKVASRSFDLSINLNGVLMSIILICVVVSGTSLYWGTETLAWKICGWILGKVILVGVVGNGYYFGSSALQTLIRR
jgi:hypothetical protein